MDSGEFQKYSESISTRNCTLDPYKSFIVDRLNLFLGHTPYIPYISLIKI
jgi:hypothetical protein